MPVYTQNEDREDDTTPTELLNFVADEQSVTRIDNSVIKSIIALCEYYKIKILQANSTPSVQVASPPLSHTASTELLSTDDEDDNLDEPTLDLTADFDLESAANSAVNSTANSTPLLQRQNAFHIPNTTPVLQQYHPQTTVPQQYHHHVTAPKRYHLYLDPSSIDVDFEFNKIKGMIERANSSHYNHRHAKTTRSTTKKKLFLDTQYRSCAMTMFAAINDSTKRTPGSFASWRSTWVNDKKPIGLTTKEAWALAAKAITDPLAIDDVVLTAEDIASREQTLVDWLVDCQRAYNIDEDGINRDGKDSPSCVHGVFLRAILALSGLHDKVKIITNPDQWAAEIAKETIASFYLNYSCRYGVSAALKINPAHLTKEQTLTITEFYDHAYVIVEHQILRQVGLEEEGGYLSPLELGNILKNISYLPLPELDEISATDSSVPINPQFNGCEPALQHHLIPSAMLQENMHSTLGEQTTRTASCEEYGQHLHAADDFYISCILSAKENPTNDGFTTINSVQDLRNMIADIVLDAVSPELSHQPLPFRGSSSTSRRVLKNMIIETISGLTAESPTMPITSPSAEHKPTTHESTRSAIVAYTTGIRNYMPADEICRMLVSAIYNRPIRLFGHHGEELIRISPQTIFVRINQQNLPLNVGLNHHHPSVNLFNPLLHMPLWPDLPLAVSSICQRSQPQMLHGLKLHQQLTATFNNPDSTGSRMKRSRSHDIEKEADFTAEETTTLKGKTVSLHRHGV